MSDNPEPAPPPESGEPSAERTVEAGASDAPRQPFVLRFPRAPIHGTDFAIRSPSFGQHSETAVDSRNAELNDRAFAVRLIARQLDTAMTADEVEAWTDQQLLAAAQTYLSLVAREPEEDGEQDEGDDYGDHAESEAGGRAPEPDASTFGGIRTAIRGDDERRSRKMRKLIAGIGSLADSNAARLTDLLKTDPNVFKAMDPLRGLDMGKLTGADAFHGLGMGKTIEGFKSIDMAQLSGTSRIAESIAKLAADTTAMERFAGSKMKLPELTIPGPIIPALQHEPMTYVGPLVAPEVRLLEEVTESLEKMHDDEVRTNEGQIEVLVDVAALLKGQGQALEALASDAKGQKWPRRIMLGATLIAAATAVVAALFAAGVWRPAGDPALAPPPPSPMLSPSVAPTAGPTPTPLASAPPSPTPVVSVSPSGSVPP